MGRVGLVLHHVELEAPGSSCTLRRAFSASPRRRPLGAGTDVDVYDHHVPSVQRPSRREGTRRATALATPAPEVWWGRPDAGRPDAGRPDADRKGGAVGQVGWGVIGCSDIAERRAGEAIRQQGKGRAWWPSIPGPGSRGGLRHHLRRRHGLRRPRPARWGRADRRRLHRHGGRSPRPPDHRPPRGRTSGGEDAPWAECRSDYAAALRCLRGLRPLLQVHHPRLRRGGWGGKRGQRSQSATSTTTPETGGRAGRITSVRQRRALTLTAGPGRRPGRPAGPPLPGPDTETALVQFAGGAYATVLANANGSRGARPTAGPGNPAKQTSIELYGTAGPLHRPLVGRPGGGGGGPVSTTSGSLADASTRLVASTREPSGRGALGAPAAAAASAPRTPTAP